MRRFWGKIRLFISFALVFFVAATVKEVSAEETGFRAVPQQNATVFDQIDGRQVAIGTLLKGQTYQVLNEDETYYYIQFGNGTGAVKKSQLLKTVSKSGQPTKAIHKNSNKTVITKTSSVIYDRTDKVKKGIAIVNKNIRYPIVKKAGDWYIVQVAGQTGYIHKMNVYEDLGIPVLMYHHMLEEPEQTPFKSNAMVIKVFEFQQQMDYLRKNGWRTILLDDLERYLQNEQNLTGRVAVITFDDNYTSLMKYAYPILKGNSQKAVSFVIGGKTKTFGQPWDPQTLQYMGYKEMLETMDIFDFQHHTQGMHLRESDSRVPYLLSRGQEEIEADLLKGIQHIGKVYEDPSRIRYLAYPWGQYNEITIQAAKAAGIRLAFTTETGNVQLGDHPYKLKRQGIGPYHIFEDFIRKIEGTY